MLFYLKALLSKTFKVFIKSLKSVEKSEEQIFEKFYKLSSIQLRDAKFQSETFCSKVLNSEVRIVLSIYKNMFRER